MKITAKSLVSSLWAVVLASFGMMAPKAAAQLPTGGSDQLVITNPANPNGVFAGTFSFNEQDEAGQSILFTDRLVINVSTFGAHTINGNPTTESLVSNVGIWVLVEPGIISSPFNITTRTFSPSPSFADVLAQARVGLSDVSDVIGDLSSAVTPSPETNTFPLLRTITFGVINDGDPTAVSGLTLYPSEVIHFVPESSAPLNVSDAFPAGYTASFTSDAEVVQVPDFGSTAPLLGLSLGAIAIIRRRPS